LTGADPPGTGAFRAAPERHPKPPDSRKVRGQCSDALPFFHACFRIGKARPRWLRRLRAYPGRDHWL